MINFFKKQFFKIVVYIVILVLINSLWFFSEWNISILVSLNSLVTSLFTFIIGKTWLEDYKLQINKELEKYKIKLSSYTLVTKLQYDLEFRIYTEVYGLVEERFRIISDMIFQMNYNKINNKSELEKSHNEIYEKILSSMYKNKPFYQKAICDKIAIINKLNSEIFKVYINFENEDLIIEDIAEKVKNIIDAIEDLSDLIRQRIENMKIIED